MKYFEEAKKLWQTYVPKTGQADTVQGELIRYVEKLRWEAQGNGNINWDFNFEYMARFLKDHLLNSGIFDDEAILEITNDINTILNFDYPDINHEPTIYVEDDLYDRLNDRVVEWCRTHPAPMPHKKDDMLYR